MEGRFSVRQLNSQSFLQGYRDEKRHRDKLGQALLEEDKGEIAREVLVVGEGTHLTRIPFLYLQQHGFVFDPSANEFVAHSLGSSSTLKTRGSKSCNPGKRAGDSGLPGVREYGPVPETTDVSLFQEWILPGLEARIGGSTSDDRLEARARTRSRRNSLDNKRTLLANLERNGRRGQAVIKDFRLADLRYRLVAPEEIKEPVPVFLLLRDVSSSLDQCQTELGWKAFNTVVSFLYWRYPQAKLLYVVHDTEAREVAKEEFFAVSQCGGTRCSSAYRLVLDILNTRYRGESYMVYGLHVSDGNCRLSDTIACRSLLSELLSISRRFAYFEVGQAEPDTSDSLYQAFLPLAGSGLMVERVRTWEDLSSGLGRVFSRQFGN